MTRNSTKILFVTHQNIIQLYIFRTHEASYVLKNETQRGHAKLHEDIVKNPIFFFEIFYTAPDLSAFHFYFIWKNRSFLWPTTSSCLGFSDKVSVTAEYLIHFTSFTRSLKFGECSFFTFYRILILP